MAGFRLRAEPLAADAATAPDGSLVGPFWLPLDVFKTSELGNGVFGCFLPTAADPASYIRVREHLRQLHMAQRLARWFAKKRALERVLLWIVPRQGVDAATLLQEFFRDPELVDYRKIWGFRFALQVALVPPDGDDEGGAGGAALGGGGGGPPTRDAAFYAMIQDNREACGIDDEGGGGGGGGPPPKKKMRRPAGAMNPERLRAEVHRASHEVRLFEDAEATFRLGPGTADWSGTLLAASTVRTMLQVIMGGRASELAHLSAFPTAAGDFNCAKAFDMMFEDLWGAFAPAGAAPAACALATEYGEVRLDGGGAALVYEVPPEDFWDRGVFATKYFPKLRPSGETVAEQLEGLRVMAFLDAARPPPGGGASPSLWEVIKSAIDAERAAAPPPPSSLAGVAFMVPDGGDLRPSDDVAAPGWAYDAARRAWTGRLRDGGREFAVRTLSLVGLAAGAERVLEVEVLGDMTRARYRLVQAAAGGAHAVETRSQWRARCVRRWLTYFDECWAPGPLMSNAIASFIRHFQKVEAESGASMLWTTGPEGRGWQFTHVNLNPQLNFFAMLLDVMELIDIKVNHHNAVRALIAFKGTYKRPLDGFKKPPHMLWVGPRSAGKSFMAQSVATLMPPGAFEICSHVSDQAYYGQAPCTDTYTANRVFFFDEGDVNKLGGRGSKSVDKTGNSVEKRSTEYKEKLTSKFTLSTVLGTDENGVRRVLQFEVSNENVQVHCMNSYFDLAPAMLSRFLLMFFHQLKRLDREMGAVAAGATTDAEAALRANIRRTMQYLHYRQTQLDMLQFAGVAAEPCLAGWNLFKVRFEQVMRRHYAGLVGSDFERRMNDDADGLMRCFLNFFAVFMVFAHHESPLAGENHFRWEMLLECEKYMVPSDATCELVMSMLEEVFFSTSQRQVMSTIKDHYFPQLRHAVPRETPAASFRRWVRDGGRQPTVTLSARFGLAARPPADAISRAIVPAVVAGTGLAAADVVAQLV